MAFAQPSMLANPLPSSLRHTNSLSMSPLWCKALYIESISMSFVIQSAEAGEYTDCCSTEG